ncbi:MULTISPECIES: MarR family winged helix-turn-helix transcriptional regulator [unclassified Streptomyces]|uniref:MarR family winged helix-turn-helix transcriptional regulator n=1 Tax=unclassified Streptomyces TaxID=2593676 RepID=UPI0007F9C34F|nr:MarR family winged helix-turn-helix transcriptional regulator [Streptomyces sp. SAT1]ANO42575.1 MarR family transcriptional regulator [Streptomyces sp. SAT1]MYR64243.1 MarR family transcriptional regulator [Streptomyces sp. SID625]
MTEPNEQERRLGDLERELTLLSRHFIASRGPRIGQSLDRSAYVLLTRLETGEPLTLKELAHTFQADVSTINRQMSAMLRHGLVERIEATTKGGARTFRPTPLGLERLAADRAISRAGAARLIEAAGWSPERTQQFLTLMIEFNHGIEQLEGLAWDHGGGAGGSSPRTAG